MLPAGQAEGREEEKTKVIFRLVKRGARVGAAVAKLAVREVREHLEHRRAQSSSEPVTSSSGRPGADDVAPSMEVISATKTRERLEAGEIVLLDCRELHEREAGFIDGSVHIPMNELPDRVSEIDPGRATVVYCLHGLRSAEVAGWLSAHHELVDVVSMDGGIVAWYSELGQDRIKVLRSEDH